MEEITGGLNRLRRKTSGYWPERILSQLEYAAELSRVKAGRYDKLIYKAAAYLEDYCVKEGALTKSAVHAAEDMLHELSGDAKSYHIICAAHAHIDMNWMWGLAETVAITIDTFRTMLDMMKEYPDFTFSQSQASVYRIVEEYDPEMLKEIKARMKEGRWEVTASTWVETDKNMPNGESLTRHILYTKEYLSGLLEIAPDSLNLDFEPDTFGHSLNVPEILTRGGIKYYYHCRGYDGHHIYRWRSPSGSTVLVYRERDWYNADIRPDMARSVPEFCSAHGMDTMLKVYGVGDHGGGPTRRDIEKIMDMSGWPVFPSIRFGTFREYFRLLEGQADRLPVVEGELNFIFRGCYTTQTRIKLSNRIGEARLNEAEAFGAIAAVFAGTAYPGEALKDAWKKVLFSHFHDILPGSGMTDTREYTLGQFQQVQSAANMGISKALRGIAGQIDTASLIKVEEDSGDTVSEGAGAGYAVDDYSIPQAERGKGRNRIFHFFNPSAYDRTETVEVTVWDWPGDKSRIRFTDAVFNEVKHQLLEPNVFHPTESYWGHTNFRLAVDVSVPACGYSTYLLGEASRSAQEYGPIPDNWYLDRPESYVMENALIKVAFDPSDASIRSFFDKRTGKELVDASRKSGVFRLVDEDDARGMTAWIIGRYMNIANLTRDVKIRAMHLNKDNIRQWLSFETGFGASCLKVTVSLDHNSCALDYTVMCHWLEIGRKGKSVPQLNFHMPFAYNSAAYKYDIPYGTIIREGADADVPANSWALAMPGQKGGSAIMAITGTKYGFRGFDNSISLTLIRSSYDPDPYPELGVHKFKFRVCAVMEPEDNASLLQAACDYNHPIYSISNARHEGTLPYKKSFMSLEKGTVILSAVKMPEAANGARRLILRAYETAGMKTRAVIRFAEKIEKGYFTDFNENPLPSDLRMEIDGCGMAFEMEPWHVSTVCIEFKGSFDEACILP